MVLEHPEQASLIWGWQGLLPYVSEVLTELNNLYLYSFLKWWSWNLQLSTNGSSDFQSWLCHCSECRFIQWVSKNVFFILAKRNLQFSVSWSLRRSYQTHTVEPSAQLIPRSECMYVFDIHAQGECVYWLWFSAFILYLSTFCNMPHSQARDLFLCFFYCSAFCLTFPHIYALMDISESNSGLVSCPRVFGTQTGAVRSISKWPALPPELQTPLLLPVFASLFCSCPNLFWAFLISTKSKKLF